MTSNEFNEKYRKYLEKDHYGLAIDIPEITNYLDQKFQEFIKTRGFTYSQIKMKFGSSRFYCHGVDDAGVEEEINRLYKIHKS